MKKTSRLLSIFALVGVMFLSLSFGIASVKAQENASEDTTVATTMTEKGTVKISDHLDYAFADYGYFYLNLVGSDYPEGSAYANVLTTDCKLDELNILDNILINGSELSEYSSDIASFDFKINQRQRYKTIGFTVPGISNVKNIITFEVKKGCRIPAYNDGTLGEKYFTLSERYYYINEDLQTGYEIPDDAVTITEKQASIVYDIKFNFFLSESPKGKEVDTSHILFNEKTLDEVNAEKSYITAKWANDTRLTLSVTVKKACPDLKNSKYRYVQNYFALMQGMALPENNSLKRSYRLCVYDDEVVTELYKKDDPNRFSTNQISGITFDLDDGTSNVAALIKVTFASAISNENIPAEGDYFIASSEKYKEQTWHDKKVWSKHVYRAFMHDGFKSSLMDNVLINGLSIAQWCAIADPASTAKDYAVAVHYGEYGGKVMSIHFTAHSTLTKKALVDSYNDGSLSVDFKPGLKFVTGGMVKTEQKFVFRKSTESFVPATLEEFSVYYNGSKIENGATIEGYGLIDKNSLYIPNDGNQYYVSFDTKKNGTTEVTIYLNRESVFFFTIKKTD